MMPSLIIITVSLFCALILSPRYRFLVFYCFRIFLLDLYGINVRPIAPVGSASRKPYVDSALIHHILPDELLFEVFVFYSLVNG